MSKIDWASCPEATHFDPIDQNFLREVGETLLLFNNKLGWTMPLHTVYGLRVEDCNRPLVKRPYWNGAGSPPVGTVCSYRHTHHAGVWYDGEILYVSDEYTIVKGHPVGEQHYYTRNLTFRPIRTPEQIAADERGKAIAEMAEVSRQATGFGQNIADHAALYDAGYRKLEAP